MHLRSLTLKGFKSFPDRTKLEFSPGVSVVVGPNGSGKSNITDAVLWALGEQSPLAVRGQTMQDVIFAGGPGLPSRGAAEVEVVLDNSDDALETDFSELSIVRRLDRSGEGEYRLNGARCRLVDVLELLSDTGLGKEMHSVVSQGRVEAIIHSKARDRRVLVEEAAGLGKHRKRRRRAQLKLERTDDNLARALDVEREARSLLRPLKRQAEAAELHERLERQSLEARLELARDAVRSVHADLQAAEQEAAGARARRDEAERLLTAVAERREAAETAFAEHGRAREKLSGRAYAARSALETIGLRRERARETATAAAEGAERLSRELALLEQAAGTAGPAGAPHAESIRRLEIELERLESERLDQLEDELAGLRAKRNEAERSRVGLQAVVEQRRAELGDAESAADAAREARRGAESAVDTARREVARVGAELAAVNQFLATAPAAPGGARALAEDIGADPGYEVALAAVLGPRLRAGVVADIREGERLLNEAGERGASLLLSSPQPPAPSPQSPGPGAERLLDRVSPSPEVAAVVERLLADVWVVESLSGLSSDFGGTAVTRSGRVFFAGTGELRQAPAGSDERLLEERNRREQLVAESAAAVGHEREALAALERAARAVSDADAAREGAEKALRAAVRELDETAEGVRQADWLIRRRGEAPDEGTSAVRRAELGAELRAERRLADQAERERAERARRIDGLRWRIERDAELVAAAERAAAAIELAEGAVGERHELLAAALMEDEAAGERTAAELRACAHEEAQLQGRLREASELVTVAEVRTQQVRDAAAESRHELSAVAERLGLAADPATEALTGDARDELEARIERLARRREQLGPVNPLAKQEYAGAVAHVEELESQRADLEAALSELQRLIRDTDRRIRESFEQTFEAAARNFEEVVQHLFPGGRGRLRLVPADGPRAVLGGEAEDAEDGVEDDGEGPGIEVEVTPAGKSMKRLSLLSGGEKSLVALAFLFAVFLARPCPFYILDEVEAALDDLNIDRFLELVGRFSDRAQFIIVTHQKRTMDAADCLYGVSMGGDGVSKVVSRKMPAPEPSAGELPSEAAA